jgi:hypothetical protein
MAHYFLILNAELFHQRISPALTAGWFQRSFEPCRALCRSLQTTAQNFRDRYHAHIEPLTLKVEAGLPFDRNLWRLLVGEVLLFSAHELPLLRTAPATLELLVGEEQQTTMRQAHHGSRDVKLGGFYRPDQAGWNDPADVRRIAAFLDVIDERLWSSASLAELVGPEREEQEEERTFAGQCLHELRDLYRRSVGDNVIVCEPP